MQQRDPDRRLDVGSHLVHRIGAQDQEVRARRFERASGFGQDGPGGFPITFMLEPFDLVEIDAVQDDLRRMKAPKRSLIVSLI